MKRFEFLIHGNPYDVEIFSVENNIAVIEVNGTRYEVELKSEVQTTKTPTLVRADLPIQKRETKIPKSIRSESVIRVKAPLPGTILKVMVEPGCEVEKGDTLLTMEAMKMENKVLAEKSGVVDKVLTKAGDTVLQDDVLIELS